VSAGERAEGPSGAARAQAWLDRLDKGASAQKLKALETPPELQRLMDEDDAAQADAGTHSGVRSR
jgi:hypothetical protein